MRQNGASSIHRGGAVLKEKLFLILQWLYSGLLVALRPNFFQKTKQNKTNKKTQLFFKPSGGRDKYLTVVSSIWVHSLEWESSPGMGLVYPVVSVPLPMRASLDLCASSPLHCLPSSQTWPTALWLQWRIYRWPLAISTPTHTSIPRALAPASSRSVSPDTLVLLLPHTAARTEPASHFLLYLLGMWCFPPLKHSSPTPSFSGFPPQQHGPSLPATELGRYPLQPCGNPGLLDCKHCPPTISLLPEDSSVMPGTVDDVWNVAYTENYARLSAYAICRHDCSKI